VCIKLEDLYRAIVCTLVTPKETDMLIIHELDNYVVQKHLNGYGPAFSLLSAISRVTEANGFCTLRAEKIEQLGGISKDQRIKATKRLASIGYIDVKERWDPKAHGQLPNVIWRCKITKSLLQEFADNRFVPDYNNTIVIRDKDGKLAPGLHEDMIADDVPDRIEGRPNEIDVPFIDTKAQQPRPDRPSRGISRVEIYPTPEDAVFEGGSRSFSRGVDKPRQNIYNKRRDKDDMSDRLSDPRSARVFVPSDSKKEGKSLRPAFGGPPASPSEIPASPGRNKVGGVISRKTSGSEIKSNAKFEDLDNLTVVTTESETQSFVAPTSLIPPSPIDGSNREAYLFSCVQYHHREQAYAIMAEDTPDAWREYEVLLELQVHVYGLARRHDRGVASVKPLPRDTGRLNNMMAAVDHLGGIDGAKEYLEMAFERGLSWIQTKIKHWNDLDIWTLLVSGCRNEYLTPNDGFEKPAHLLAGEWNEPSAEESDYQGPSWASGYLT